MQNENLLFCKIYLALVLGNTTIRHNHQTMTFDAALTETIRRYRFPITAYNVISLFTIGVFFLFQNPLLFGIIAFFIVFCWVGFYKLMQNVFPKPFTQHLVSLEIKQ